MATLKRIKPGDVLWDVRGRWRREIYQVRVIEVHEDHAIVSWNGNRPQRYGQHLLRKLRVKRP